jgi:hypothetical protein
MLDDRAAPISDAAGSVARHGGIAPPRWNRLTLGDSVAVLGHFARAFGREASKTVLADVGGLGEETEKADHDGSKRLDKRQAPPFQSGSQG